MTSRQSLNSQPLSKQKSQSVPKLSKPISKPEETLTRGQKAALTRAKNKKAKLNALTEVSGNSLIGDLDNVLLS